MIATGSSIAQIFGLPLGPPLALDSWRGPGLLYCRGRLPGHGLSLPCQRASVFTLKQLPELLEPVPSSRSMWSRCSWRPAYYASYSYIEPFPRRSRTSMGATTMTLTAFGCSGLLGSWLFGRLFDGHRFRFSRLRSPACRWPLLLMGLAASSLAAVLAVCALWVAAPRPLTWRFRPSSSSTRWRTLVGRRHVDLLGPV